MIHRPLVTFLLGLLIGASATALVRRPPTLTKAEADCALDVTERVHATTADAIAAYERLCRASE